MSLLCLGNNGTKSSLNLLCKGSSRKRFLRSLIKFSSADYLCFALLATASRGLACTKFYLHNPKSHLAILRLIVLRSNWKSNLQIWAAETRTLKMLKFIWSNLGFLCALIFRVKGEGAWIALCLQLRGKAEAKELLGDLSAFFSLGEEGVSTYEASPLPLPSPL